MQGKMVDIIEDIGKGIKQEQLAPKTVKEENHNDRTAAAEKPKNRS